MCKPLRDKELVSAAPTDAPIVLVIVNNRRNHVRLQDSSLFYSMINTLLHFN